MKARLYSSGDYNELKASFRSNLRLCGGNEKATGVTRISDQATIGRYANPNNPDIYPPIDVVIDMAKDTDNPEVIRTMAALCGCILISKPPVSGDPKWIAHIGRAAKEGADVIAGLSEALANDGEVTAAEIKSLGLRKQVREAIEIFSEIDKALENREAEGDK